MRVAKTKKSQTLVIGVIIVLVLGIVGWTIASMVSSNLQISSSLSDSQSALYLAEAGSNWAVQQFYSNSSWRTTGTPEYNLPHSLGNGEYNVTCLDSATPGMIDIVSTGYVPSESVCVSSPTNCRGRRVIQRSIGGASLKKLLQAGNYFDWSGYISPSQFNGAISVIGPSSTTAEFKGYNGDGDATHNEYTTEGLTDYNPRGDYGPYQPVYSGSFSPMPTRGFMGSANYPTIDMAWFRDNASNTWPSPLDRNLQMSWATVPVGNKAGSQYDYAQSFVVGGTATQRRVQDISILHGPSMGMLSYARVGDSGGQEYDCAQSFYISGSSSERTVRRIRILHGENQSNPSGRITLSIVNNNILTGKPGSTVYVSRTYNPRQLVWNTVRFLSPVVLPANDFYWIVLDAPDQPPNRYYTIRPGDDSALANPGEMRQAIDTVWQSPGSNDIAFQIERTSGSPNPIQSVALVEPQITLKICSDSAGEPGAVVLGQDTGAPLQANYTPYSSVWCTANLAGAVPDSDDRELPAGTYWLVWDIDDQPLDTYHTLRLANYASGLIKQRINGGSWTEPFSSNKPDLAFSIDTAATGAMNIRGTGEYLYSSSPDFFTGMAGEAVRNYGKTNDWAASTWAVINSVDSVGGLGTNTLAVLDHEVIYTGNPQANPVNDWYDTDDVALIKRFTGSNTAAQNWYIAAGAVFDATTGALTQTNKSFTVERDIGLVPQGSVNNIILQTNLASPRALLATCDGDIYSTRPSTSGSDTVTAQRRNLQGMVYTQEGDMTFNFLWAANGVAIVGNNLYFSNYIRADYNATIVNTDGFFAASNSTWREQ